MRQPQIKSGWALMIPVPVDQFRLDADRLASDSTLHRTIRQITPATLDKIRAAFAGVRRRMWPGHLDDGRAVVLDVDSSLVQIHSENKDETAPTFKGGFGFHPMFCFADLTGEALAARLRPGNAGANTSTDLLQVVDDAIAQLPADICVGHHRGDPADSVVRRGRVGPIQGRLSLHFGPFSRRRYCCPRCATMQPPTDGGAPSRRAPSE